MCVNPLPIGNAFASVAAAAGFGTGFKASKTHGIASKQEKKEANQCPGTKSVGSSTWHTGQGYGTIQVAEKSLCPVADRLVSTASTR